MAMYDKNPLETIFMRILNLNVYDYNYWSNLINYARLLMADYGKDRDKLEEMIYNFRCRLCEYKTPSYKEYLKLTNEEKLKLNIPEFWKIMLSINNTDDYSSYFKDKNGNKITRIELEGELEKIKEHIFSYMAILKEHIRFTQVQP